jgi:hypothetical protein
MAEIHMLEGAWSKAETLLLEGQVIRERVLDPLDPMHEESLNLLGTVYMRTVRYDEAKRHFQSSRERATKAADLGLAGPNAPGAKVTTLHGRKRFTGSPALPLGRTARSTATTPG